MKKRCIVAYLFLFSNILFASYENFNGKDVSGQSFRSDYSLTYSTWISATAIGTDFGYANLGGANFSNAQSNNANFEYATFLVDWGIDEPQPNYANFNNAIINGASFNGTVDKGFLAENLYSTGSYKNKDLSNIRLGINNLTGWNFSNQNLTGAYFGGATLTNANFTGANINSVDFSGANGFTYDMFKSTQTFKDKNIKGVNFAISPRIDSWDFSGLTINNCNFTELYANVTYGELYYCNFNNTDLRNSSLKKTTGTTFTDAKINSSQINISIDALKNTWSYKNKNLRDIDFYDTNLVSDLTEMDLSNATFEKCTLIRFIRDGSGWGSAYAGINMYNSIINGADFSKAVIFDKVTSAPEGFKYQAFYNIETLYNTLSYKNRDLSNIHFGYFMFSGNFK